MRSFFAITLLAFLSLSAACDKPSKSDKQDASHQGGETPPDNQNKADVDNPFLVFVVDYADPAPGSIALVQTSNSSLPVADQLANELAGNANVAVEDLRIVRLSLKSSVVDAFQAEIVAWQDKAANPRIGGVVVSAPQEFAVDRADFKTKIDALMRRIAEVGDAVPPSVILTDDQTLAKDLADALTSVPFQVLEVSFAPQGTQPMAIISGSISAAAAAATSAVSSNQSAAQIYVSGMLANRLSPLVAPVGGGTVVAEEFEGSGGKVRAVVVLAAAENTYEVPPTGISWKDPQATIVGQLKAAREAHKSGGLLVKFPKKTIYFDQAEQAHIVLKNLEDMIIDFGGSTLRFGKNKAGIMIVDSKRLTVRNANLRYTFPIVSTGKIEQNAGRKRIAVHDNYLVGLDTFSSDFGFESSGTIVRSYKTVGDVKQIGGNGLESYPKGLVYAGGFWECDSTVSDSDCNGTLPQAVDEKVMIISNKNVGAGVVVRGTAAGKTSDIALSQLNMSNIAGCGVFTNFDGRGLLVDRVTIEPLSSRDFIGASACGVRTRAMRGDIIIRNSKLADLGDDGANIQTDNWVAKAPTVNGSLVKVEVTSGGHQPVTPNSVAAKGETVVLFDEGMRPVAAGTVSQSAAIDVETVNLEFELPSGVMAEKLPAVMRLGTLERATSRVVVKNSEFVRSRARGLLIQANHARIYDVDANENAGNGLLITSHVSGVFAESFGAANILVGKSRFVGNNFRELKNYRTFTDYAAVAVSANLGAGVGASRWPSFRLFRNITFVDNVVSDTTGSVLQVASARQVLIRGNKFLNVTQRAKPWASALAYPEQQGAQVFLSQDVTIEHVAADSDPNFAGFWTADVVGLKQK